MIDGIRAASTEIADRHLTDAIPAGPWRDWAVCLVPAVTLEAVIAWLDTGQPDPDHAADRINRTIDAIVHAAQPN